VSTCAVVTLVPGVRIKLIKNNCRVQYRYTDKHTDKHTDRDGCKLPVLSVHRYYNNINQQLV
jgi:hypothetical protein